MDPLGLEFLSLPILLGDNMPFHFSIAELQDRLRVAQGLQQDPIQKAIQANLDASCSIYVSSGGENWTGSGYHIGHGLIITANHVVPEAIPYQTGELQISFDGESRIDVQVVGADANVDATILWCPGCENYTRIHVGDSDACQVGEVIAVIANPEGWHGTVTVGRLSNAHQDLGEAAPTPAWHDVFFIDADILQGASGGMVINTDGKVIGHVMGVAGTLAAYGVGESAVSPINRIKPLIVETARKLS